MQHFFDLLATAGPIALAAIGFALIYRVSGHMHFAYLGMWTFTSYLIVWFNSFGLHPFVSMAISAVPAVGIAMVCLWLYRRLSGQWTLVLVAFGIAIFLEGLTQFIWGPEARGYNQEHIFSNIWQFDLFGKVYYFPASAGAALAAALLIGVALAYGMGRTKTGLATRAVADSPEVAKSTGIRTGAIRVSAYIVGTLIMTLSAGLHTLGVGASLGAGEVLILQVLAVTILAGPVIVAVLLSTLLFAALLTLANMIAGPEFITLIGYAALFGLLRLRPNGLFKQDFVFKRQSVRTAKEGVEA